jgi:nucleoside-diphosphate-sugar epimerase
MAEPQTTISKGSLVLITGITGHVASELTKQFLERGYKVRGTVRDLAKASWLVNDVFKSYADRGDLELVPIPDITVEGGFDDAVKGASAVVHVATIGFDPDPNKVVTPTVKATLSILNAALKEPSVKQFVYTGSIVATAMLVPGNTENITKYSWNDAVLEIAWAPPPYNPDRTFPVYMASKVAAEKALWKFVDEEKPPFAVNVVTPQTIIGKRLSKNCTSLSASILPSLYEGNLEITHMLPASEYQSLQCHFGVY